MSIPCYIIDDDSFSIKSLTTELNKIPWLSLIGSDTDPIAALNKILSGIINPEIIFIDIDMPDIGGIDLSEQIAHVGVIIFITGYPAYALQAFSTQAVDFLIKPVTMPGLIRAVQKAKEKLIARKRNFIHAVTDRYIFVKVGPSNIVRVNVKDIIYIVVVDKYLNIHGPESRPIMIKKSLNFVEQVLPEDMFIRISQSCIVNLTRAKSIVGNQIVLDSGLVLSIGSTYMQDVYAKYNSI